MKINFEETSELFEHENVETIRILQRIIEQLRAGIKDNVIMDLYGNSIGTWSQSNKSDSQIRWGKCS